MQMKIFLSLLLALLVGLCFALSPGYAQATNQVGLVVVHGDGQVKTACVEFGEGALNGYDVLQRSGLDLNVEVNGMGATICRIDNEGCTYPQQSCFCGTESDTYTYWSYWHMENGVWAYSNLGASNTQVQPGMVEGWIWGAGSPNGATPPPAFTFDQICVPATFTPTATSTLTSTPTEQLPTSTATPSASALPILPPTATSLSTELPTATPIPTPGVLSFRADRDVIDAGEPVTLTWNTVNADGVILRTETSTEAVSGVGTKQVTPLTTTIYTLIGHNFAGEAQAVMAITVNIAPFTPAATMTALSPNPTATNIAVTPAITSTLPVQSPMPTRGALPAVTQTPMTTLTATAILSTALLVTAPQPEVSPTSVATATPTATPTITPFAVALKQRSPAVSVQPLVSATDAARTRMLLLLSGVVFVAAVPLVTLGIGLLVWTLSRLK